MLFLLFLLYAGPMLLRQQETETRDVSKLAILVVGYEAEDVSVIKPVKMHWKFDYNKSMHVNHLFLQW